MSEDNKSTTIVVQVDYNNWSKEELIDKIRKLECHVKQLRNVIFKSNKSINNLDDEDNNPRKRLKLEDDSSQSHKKKDKKDARKFDFST